MTKAWSHVFTGSNFIAISLLFSIMVLFRTMTLMLGGQFWLDILWLKGSAISTSKLSDLSIDNTALLRSELAGN
jgi:hypothetical protein